MDGAAQIIVAAEITQDSNDKQQLAPMLAGVERNMGAKPEAATADAGYFSEEQLSDEWVTIYSHREAAARTAGPSPGD